jgi:MATE family multidrug resistance protein
MRFWLPTLYTQDAAVIELAALLMLYAGIFQIFDGSQTVFLAMLRGVRDVRIPTMFAVVSYAAVNIPLSYLLAFPFGFGPQGIWMGYVLGLVAASSLYYLRFRRVSATMSFEEPATTL